MILALGRGDRIRDGMLDRTRHRHRGRALKADAKRLRAEVVERDQLRSPSPREPVESGAPSNDG